jgi:pantoate--beta-alanine ligase
MTDILITQLDIQTHTASIRAKGKTIGFVPTMGALHDGHLTLARRALVECDVCIVSIFVNPKQFAPHEDFDRYPRNLEKDITLLAGVGVQSVFAPSSEVMYPPGFQTTVMVGNVSRPLEGEFRPHFFSGVATVIARLLLLVGAHKAYFGEKDYQQLQVVRAMQQDLAIPTEIVGVPTIRDESGLAMSSRNAYLSAEKKTAALSLNRTLLFMAEKVKAGQEIARIESDASRMLMEGGFDKVDYITVRDAMTLGSPTSQTVNLRILGAAWIGGVRLIDNIGVSPL